MYDALGAYTEWTREKEEVKKKSHGDVVKRCMKIVVERTVEERDEAMLEVLLKGEWLARWCATDS